MIAACQGAAPATPIATAPSPGVAEWLAALIDRIEREPVTNAPSSIASYTFHGETVYFRPSRCCDIRSELYDVSGALICQPDGGITGKGDGRCPDFFAARTDEQVVWLDSRR